MKLYIEEHGWDMPNYVLIKINNEYYKVGVIYKRRNSITRCIVYDIIDFDDYVDKKRVRNITKIEEEEVYEDYDNNKRKWIKQVFNR